MKLRIQKRLFSWRVVNESGAIVAKIRNKKLIGAAKEIIDENNKVVYTTDKVKLSDGTSSQNHDDFDQYIIYKDQQPVATAALVMADHTDKSNIQKFNLRVPQVEIINVNTPNFLWRIQRQNNNGLVITQDSVPLGSVSPFFRFKPIQLELKGKCDTVFLAAIYVLIDYMMHEDETYVV